MSESIYKIWRWLIASLVLILWIIAYSSPLAEFDYGGNVSSVFWFGWDFYNNGAIDIEKYNLSLGNITWIAITVQLFSIILIESENPTPFFIFSFLSTFFMIIGFVTILSIYRGSLEHLKSGYYTSLATVLILIIITILLRVLSKKQLEKMHKSKKEKEWEMDAVRRAESGDI